MADQLAAAWAAIEPMLSLAIAFVSNPWARAIGLVVIVYLTIRVIASVYSGDMQNSVLGPVGIRTHTAQRLGRDTMVLPRFLMPMNMDGVSAKLKLFYAYTDARGKQRKRLVYTRPNAKISVSPVKLTRTSTTIYGQEIPDVATADVCFPPIEISQTPSDMPATPDNARDYAALHKVVENWKEDDDALLVSVHADEHDAIADGRLQFITATARKVALAREGNALQRWLKRGAAKQRANVVGSYYVKLEFSHDPLFVLTRHPDRDLKMTAWLTVLTSMFALVMDAWPKMPTTGEAVASETRVVHEQSATPAPRVAPRVP
jgi:hypothetical protein